VPERRAARPAARVRCESCLAVLSLRHHWDTATCSCGAVMVSGRPHKPTVHWLSGPGRGWTELEAASPDDAQDQVESMTDTGAGPGDDAAIVPGRVLGYVDVGALGL
jgi:hypothetical protein